MSFTTKTGILQSVLVALLVVTCSVKITYAQGGQSVSAEIRVQQDRETRRAQFEMASKCAREARRQFEYQGYRIDAHTTFTNRYNPQSNHCFFEIDSSQPFKGELTETKFLADAVEGKVLGRYSWMSRPGKQFWEVEPNICSVTMPSGEEKDCSSEHEFDALVAQYMR